MLAFYDSEIGGSWSEEINNLNFTSVSLNHKSKVGIIDLAKDP
jgi:hypothetical protein